ncbi:hypothetical protein WJX77_011154 [Trebouxia sp. C0004]
MSVLDIFSETVDLRQACLIATGVYCLWRLGTFIRADADLSLWTKRLPPKNAFEDQVVWITGASQGLGEELAHYFAAHGARLILSSRKKEQLQRVKAECIGKHAPDGIKVLPFDLIGPPEELQQAAAAAVQAFPSLDYLIHNAGASQHALAEDTSPDVTQKLFQLNTLAPINLTQALLPHILSSKPPPQSAGHAPSQSQGDPADPRAALPASGPARQCHIVVVGSMAGKVPSPGQSVYSGCKTALMGYFASLQTELSTRGVTVTICCPGPVATGSPEQPRAIYNGAGLITTNSSNKGSSKRMSPPRVAELIGKATYHRVDECWIARHPVLLMGYLMQYFPSLGIAVMKKIGPGRAAQMKGGSSGYDVKSMLFQIDRQQQYLCHDNEIYYYDKAALVSQGLLRAGLAWIQSVDLQLSAGSFRFTAQPGIDTYRANREYRLAVSEEGRQEVREQHRHLHLIEANPSKSFTLCSVGWWLGSLHGVRKKGTGSAVSPQYLELSRLPLQEQQLKADIGHTKRGKEGEPLVMTFHTGQVNGQLYSCACCWPQTPIHGCEDSGAATSSASGHRQAANTKKQHFSSHPKGRAALTDSAVTSALDMVLLQAALQMSNSTSPDDASARVAGRNPTAATPTDDTPQEEYDFWNPPQYQPAESSQADLQLSPWETAHVFDSGLQPHPGRAHLDTENSSCTLLTAALQSSWDW